MLQNQTINYKYFKNFNTNYKYEKSAYSFFYYKFYIFDCDISIQNEIDGAS